MPETLHIYTRVSTASQADEGVSLENQRDHGITKAKSLGMDWKIWEEGAASSNKEDLLNRPQLLGLLSAIDSGEVTDLFVYNNDRLSRNEVTQHQIKTQLIKHNVKLHTPQSSLDWSNPTDVFLKTILDGMAAYENVIRTQRSVEGKLRRVAEGYWKGGPPPYGYEIQKKKLAVNATEAKWVEFIFENYADGKSVDFIRNELIRSGVSPRRGGLFSHGSINRILRNSHYGGYWYFTDKKTNTTLRNSCPEILSDELIESVRTQIEQRSYSANGKHRSGTSNKKYTYLLDDLLWCNSCDCKFTGHTFSKRLSAKQSDYYFCLSKRKKYSKKHNGNFEPCSYDRNLRLSETDELIWNTAVEVLSQSHLFKEEIKKEAMSGRTYAKQGADVKKIQTQIRKIEKELDGLSQSKVTLNTKMLVGDLNKSETIQVMENVEQNIKERKRRLGDLEKELEQENAGRKWVDWVGKFKKTIEDLKTAENLNLDERKEFLNGVIEKVVVTGEGKNLHSFDIHFRLPYVGDEFVALEKGKRKKGKWYNLKEGTNVYHLTEFTLKKTVG